jgi:hypothetical protein
MGSVNGQPPVFMSHSAESDRPFGSKSLFAPRWSTMRGLVFSFLWVAVSGLGLVPAASAQPATLGSWSAVQTWPTVSVHTHLLATGNILFWDYSGSSYLWDPTTGTITQPAQPGRNTFCAGNSTLANGAVFVPGGHIANNVGLASASYYDPMADTWTAAPDMNAGRWYPSSTSLANGDVLVTSGDTNVSVRNTLPQVYQAATNSWRDLTTAPLALTLFPRAFLAPNGQVFFATGTSRYLDTTATGIWTTVGNKINPGTDNYGSAAMYDNGKVIFSGGADPPTAAAEVVDLNSLAPAWTPTASMASARRQLNLTLLPDGKVLATGGSAGPGFDNSALPALAAEVWDPATGQWTTLASENNYRGYHSCATLLPDGRVLSSGGDTSPNAQVFSPPYLFNGARPTIDFAPAVVPLGSQFFVATPDAGSITKVTWTRLGNETHAFNWNQRINVLAFTSDVFGLNVAAPSDPNSCPPGHYLLWILNGSGVPSVAAIVQVTQDPPIGVLMGSKGGSK